METHKMLALSTGHITMRTAESMRFSLLENRVISYDKHGYGWFVYVPEDDELEEVKAKCSKDLYQCITFARDNGCDWIMFDRDVEPIDELPIYEWR